MTSAAQPRVALTGASGFLGRHIDAALRRSGCDVHVIDRGVLTAPDDVLDAALHAAGDIDVIVHLAAAGVSPKPATPETLLAVNIELPARLVAAAARTGVAHLIMAGTAAEYGASADKHAHLSADAPLRPTSPYARSKAIGFAAAVDAARELAVVFDHLRVFNAFGPGQDARALWPALHAAAARGTDLELSSGTQVRDFIPVGAVADVFTALVLHPYPQPDARPGVRVRNVGTGGGTSVQRFAEQWWEHWGATGTLRLGAIPDREDEPRRMVADDGTVVAVTGPIDVDRTWP